MLNKLEKLEDICPTCEQEIDAEFKSNLVAEELAKIASMNIRKRTNEKLITRIKTNNSLFDKKQKTQKEWEDLYRSIDHTLAVTPINKKELEEKIHEVGLKLTNAKRELEKISKENERRTRENTRIEIIQAQTDGFINKLNAAQTLLNEQKELDSNLEILKKAFSTNGLLAYKIESLVKELEILTNEYLAEFSDGRFSINFVVENDKLNVEVSDNGNIIDILALSSGELARVNIATLVAIRKLMTSISRSQINVLFLDEVNQALDEQGKEKVVEVLLKEENLNTYLVSHGWTHPLLEKIEIIKEDNISRLD